LIAWWVWKVVVVLMDSFRWTLTREHALKVWAPSRGRVAKPSHPPVRSIYLDTSERSFLQRCINIA
jgi:hypothetical protein